MPYTVTSKDKWKKCFIFIGHKEVEPASGVKGMCYTYKGNTETEELANEEHLDEIEDQEAEELAKQGKFYKENTINDSYDQKKSIVTK